MLQEFICIAFCTTYLVMLLIDCSLYVIAYCSVCEKKKKRKKATTKYNLVSYWISYWWEKNWICETSWINKLFDFRKLSTAIFVVSYASRNKERRTSLYQKLFTPSIVFFCQPYPTLIFIISSNTVISSDSKYVYFYRVFSSQVLDSALHQTRWFCTLRRDY